MQNIVDAYVKLGNTKALEDLKAHRQGLVIAVDGRLSLNPRTSEPRQACAPWFADPASRTAMMKTIENAGCPNVRRLRLDDLVCCLRLIDARDCHSNGRSS
jgi:hypothetical protein